MPELKQDFLPDDLLPQLQNFGFDGSIAVQARMNIDETRWLLKLAEENTFIKGVVGWVDLCSPRLEKSLEEFSENVKLVGVRHIIHDEPDDNFMARPDFQRGISLLEKYDLTYDLLVFPKHLPLALDLVKRFPRQKFVIDHLGKPLIREQRSEPWENHIKRLAKFPNVYCKLSGMVTEADPKHWLPAHFSRYLDVVFECFGVERSMIGSDWPVCTVGGSYPEIMDIVVKYLDNYSQEVKDKVLGLNCRKFYLE